MTEYDHEDLERADLTRARKAGADTFFLILAAVDPGAVDVPYNHVATKLAHTDDLSRDSRRWGDFMGNLWDGDIAEALYHADGTNMRLIIRTLSRDVLLAALAEDRGSMESAERWFKPNEDRYGWRDEHFE